MFCVVPAAAADVFFGTSVVFCCCLVSSSELENSKIPFPAFFGFTLFQSSSDDSSVLPSLLSTEAGGFGGGASSLKLQSEPESDFV